MSDTEGVFEVESILGSRIMGGHELFLVKWVGFPKSSATWEPIDSLVTCDEVLADFRKRQQKEKNKKKDNQKEQEVFRPQIPVDQTYEVDKVIADRTFGGNMEFLVRFTMQGVESNWIPLTDLNCQESIDDYFKRKESRAAKRKEIDFDQMIPDIGNPNNKKILRIITILQDRNEKKLYVQFQDRTFGVMSIAECMKQNTEEVLVFLEQFAFNYEKNCK